MALFALACTSTFYLFQCSEVPPLTTALLCAVGTYNDLYQFDPTAVTWIQLAASSPGNAGPSATQGMGFTATPDGMIYFIDGGYGESMMATILSRPAIGIPLSFH